MNILNELTEGMSYTITVTATNRIGRSVPIESKFIVSCKELIPSVNSFTVKV